jgi:hypothetical protein
MNDSVTMPAGPDAASDSLDALRAGVGAVAAALAEAGARVATGGFMDLAGLDGRIAGLCAAATSLAPAGRLAMVGELQSLLERLDALNAVMAGQFDAMALAERQTARGRAAAAYGLKAPPPAPEEG